MGIYPTYAELNTPLQGFNDSNNTQMIAQMALAGMGVAVLPSWLIVQAVEQGRLVKLFDTPVQVLPIFAIYMNRAFLSSKMRLLIDFLIEKINV